MGRNYKIPGVARIHMHAVSSTKHVVCTDYPELLMEILVFAELCSFSAKVPISLRLCASWAS